MSDGDYAKQLEIQRKAFEAQFGSLEAMGFEDKTKNETQENSSSVESQESEQEDGDNSSDEAESDASFHGFSDDESSAKQKAAHGASRAPRVIKFGGVTDAYVPPSKKEQKLLRLGKAPVRKESESEEDGRSGARHGGSDGEGNVEAENLHNDLELQRFLKESHLLSAFGSTPSGADLTLQTMDNVEYKDDAVFGKARARTLEMRLQNLSSANGRSRKLEKVPMNIRKGMVQKHTKRIQQHEREARDAGVVLSKVKKGEFRKIDRTYRNDIERRIGSGQSAVDPQRIKHRQRGLQVNSVGRSTRNGLIISSQEIKAITGSSGPKRAGGSKHKRRR